MPRKQARIVKFIRRMATRIIIFMLVTIAFAAIRQSIAPIVSNSLALSQMQNDDAAFVIMNTYNRLKSIASTIYTLIILWFVYKLGRDTYKFVKTNNTADQVISTNEKEN